MNIKLERYIPVTLTKTLIVLYLDLRCFVADIYSHYLLPGVLDCGLP